MRLRLLGAGGHAKVTVEAAQSACYEVLALHDDNPELHGARILGVIVHGTIDEALTSNDAVHLAIGNNYQRRRIAARAEGCQFLSIVHSKAEVGASADLAPGVFVGAGVIVQADAKIGRHTIVNSQALVEHDDVLGDFVHIAPGVRLGGNVTIGNGTMVGIGAVVLPGVSIGEDSVVGAGAVVIRDVPPRSVVVGNPARLLRELV